MLVPGNGKTKTGYLWVYARDDRASGSSEPPAVWFASSPDRGGEHPQRHLAHFAGLGQADTGFAELHRHGRITEIACWAHARRKIHDLHAVRPTSITTEALARNEALYRIEEHIRREPPEERRRIRQSRVVPLLDELNRWFETTKFTLSAKSDITKAIQYSMNRSPALVHYGSDGRAEINNLIARLGGFPGRKGDDEPGAKTIWPGLGEVHIAGKALRLLRDDGDDSCVCARAEGGFGPGSADRRRQPRPFIESVHWSTESCPIAVADFALHQRRQRPMTGRSSFGGRSG